jgi:hypothetical protein
LTLHTPTIDTGNFTKLCTPHPAPLTLWYLCMLQSTLFHTLHSAVSTPHSTLYTCQSPFYTSESALHTLHSMFHATLLTLRTGHSSLQTEHSTLDAPHSAPYTILDNPSSTSL